MEKNTHEKTVSYFGVPAKTLGLVVVLATVAGLLVFYAASPQKYMEPKQQEQVSSKIADTSLTIEPLIKQADGSYSSAVFIDTQSNRVTAVQLELVYDPLVLQNVDISPLDFFAQPVEVFKNIDPKNGRISYALGIPAGESGFSGSGNLAKITYTIASRSAQLPSFIKFLPKTEVSSENTSVSVLNQTQDGIIDITFP